MNGRTVLTDGNSATDANLYHDYGFLHLAPNEVMITCKYGWFHRPTAKVIGRYVSDAYPPFKDEYVGKYIHSLNTWRKIKSRSGENYIAVDYTLDEVLDVPDVTNDTMTIASTNNLVITPVSTMSLTKLNFIYKPTFA